MNELTLFSLLALDLGLIIISINGKKSILLITQVYKVYWPLQFTGIKFNLIFFSYRENYSVTQHQWILITGMVLVYYWYS